MAQKCETIKAVFCQCNTERLRTVVHSHCTLKGQSTRRHRENKSTNIFGETGRDAGSTFDTGHG